MIKIILIIITFSKRTYLYTSYIQFDIVVRTCSVAKPYKNRCKCFIYYLYRKCKLIFDSDNCMSPSIKAQYI